MDKLIRKENKRFTLKVRRKVITKSEEAKKDIKPKKSTTSTLNSQYSNNFFTFLL